jgi:hypothetical protein
MVNFSIFDAIGNNNENNPIPDPTYEEWTRNKVQQSTKSNHELTAEAQTETKTQTREYFPISIYDSIGLVS